jgi:hypothetical protein
VDQLSELKKQLLLKKLYEGESIGDSGFVSKGEIVPFDNEMNEELSIAIDPVQSKILEESNRKLQKDLYDISSSQGIYIDKMMKNGISDYYKEPFLRDIYRDGLTKSDKLNIIRQYRELSDQEYKKRDKDYGIL